MKSINCLAIALLLLSVSGCTSSPPQEVSPSDPSTTVTSLIDKLEPSLLRAASDAETEGLELTEVIITLNTITAQADSGALKLLIFKVGQQKKVTNTSTFVIKMVKPDGSGQTSAQAERFMDALAGMISAARKGIAGLETGEVTGTLKFALESKSSVGAEKEWDVVPVGITGSRNLTDSYTHTVKITFKKKPRQDGDAV